MITKEDFTLTLIKQYSQAIEEVVIDSESVYRSQLDFVMLDKKLNHILTAARIDGLDESFIWAIIEKKVPLYYEYCMSGDLKVAA